MRDASLVAAAVGYASKGWSVFPCEPDDKKPKIRRGFKAATTDPEEIRQWWTNTPDANIGVATGEVSGIVVLDVDVKNGVDGEASLRELLRVQGAELPPTLESRTPSGGRHLFFSVPEGVKVRSSAGTLGPGLDVRGEGGYVVVSPSRVNGTQYEWHGSKYVAPAPDWLAAPTSEAVGGKGERIGAGRRNQELTRIAGRMRVAGLESAAIEAALSVVNESRCDPPLPAREVRTIAASVGRYATRDEPEPCEWPESLDLITLAETEPQPPAMIMEGLPVGYATGLFGHGGAGKSNIALQLAVCIAQGAPFYGLEVAKRKVLYLSCEDRADVLHWRLRRICAYHRRDLAALQGSLHVVDLVGHQTIVFASPDARTGHSLTAAFGALANAIESYQAEVLFVDGIADSFGGNENARAEVKAFVNALLGLIPASRGAIVLVGHVNKLSARSKGTSEGYSGSTAWHNSIRARWYLRPDNDEDGADDATFGSGMVLELQKSNHGAAGLRLPFFWEEHSHLFTSVGVESGGNHEARNHEEREGIVAAFCECERAGDYVPTSSQGRKNAFSVLSQCKSFPERLKRRGKRAKTRFWDHIQFLRLSGQLKEVPHVLPSRHRTTAYCLAANASNEN